MKVSEKKEKQPKKKKGTGKTKLGIGAQLLIGFAVPVLFVIVIGVQAYTSSSKGLTNNFKEASGETIRMTTEYLDMICESISSEAFTYAFNSKFNDYYGARLEDQEAAVALMTEINDMMTNAKIGNSFINNIHIVTKEGVSFISTSSTKTTKIMERYGFFETQKDAFQKQYGARVPNWIDSHELVDESMKLKPEETLMSYVIATEHNNAYVVIDISRKEMQKTLDEMNLGEGSIVGIITAQGTECVSGTEEAAFFTSLEDYEKVVNGKASGTDEITYNGKKYLLLYSKSDKDAYTLCAMVPMSTVTGQATQIGIVTAVLVVIAIAVAVGTGLFISARIVGSVKKMMKFMKTVTEGDLTKTVSDKGSDEFALLAGSMNTMVVTTKGLVLQVADSTKNMETSTKAVSKVSEVINDYSESITTAIGEIHSGMNVQAENAQECLVKTDALSQEIQAISERVEEIGQNIIATGEKINQSMDIMSRLGESAVQTSAITDKVAESIQMLQEQFENIQGFVETINSISEETNLLSLNASIEAARAGDAGRGFAVVADQIRKLADGAGEAAAEIQKTVEDIKGQTDSSVERAQLAKDMVKQQTKAVEDVQVSFRSMQEDMEIVVRNMRDITANTEKADVERAATLQAIENISAVIEQTAASAAVVNDTADKLLGHVNELQGTASVLEENMSSLKQGISVFKTE